jgi:tetratricopeptide (TPR) repeat protein
MRTRGGRRARYLEAGVVALALLAAGAAVAAPEGDAQRREQAVAGLRSEDPADRARACAELGEAGRDADLPHLMRALHDSAPTVRAAAEQAVWRIWSRSGDAAADRLFAAGVAQMQSGDLRGAVETFGQVIRDKPEFAEAWNKRATVWFLLGENDLSLRDCDEVIKRNPLHFGVLAGYGQILTRKGDLPGALRYFERALAINPNMEGVRGAIEAIGEVLAERRKRFI